MKSASIYAVETPDNHLEKLYAIIQLSKLGAAATDTVLNLENLLDAHQSLYETIHRLACEGVELAGKELDKQEASTPVAADALSKGKAA